MWHFLLLIIADGSYAPTASGPQFWLDLEGRVEELELQVGMTCLKPSLDVHRIWRIQMVPSAGGSLEKLESCIHTHDVWPESWP